MNELLGFPYKEEVKVEDWVGDDSEARQKAGEPPDDVKTFTTWYEADGTEITDPDRILALEASIVERK